jgi:putative Mg2+ transporter-C (MgtC) family protein
LTIVPHIYGDEIFKLLFSAVIGCLLGFEREIRRKPAGFRTLAMICLGATVFTICSYTLGSVDNRDRIAANIITGVGFLGAGVIFRNGSSVSGITTASTIWIAAALGTLIGIGDYVVALITLTVALFILDVLEFVQFWIDDRYQRRNYTLILNSSFSASEFKEEIRQFKLKTYRIKQMRRDQQITVEFELTGQQPAMERFDQWLINNDKIYSFVW